MAHPFKVWRRDLKGYGFVSSSTGGRKGIYMLRRNGAITKAIGAMIHRHRPEEFSVTFHIGMPLRCADPLYDVVILSGDLAPAGVRIDGLLSYLAPGSTAWWTLDRLEEAWVLIEEDGLAWLERFSDPGTLIEHFERESTREKVMHTQLEGETLLRRLVRGLTGRRPSQRKRPYHDYLLWLAMLYEEVGDIERARNRLEAYATIAPLFGDEVERLERHRRALLERTADR